jgi:hypothetical protein
MVIDARAVLKDKIVLAGAAMVFSVLGGAGWVLFGDSSSSDEMKAGQRYTHLHCPACRYEIDCNPAKVSKTCESCEKNTYTPTNGSTPGGGVGRWSRLVLYLLFATLLLQGLAFLSVHRLRVLRQAAHKAGSRRLLGLPLL